MSNIKRIRIEGWMPFDAGGSQELLARLGQISMPCMGLNLTWGRRAKYVENEHGGKTAMYTFSLTGEEAVSNGWLDTFVSQVTHVGGAVREAVAFDTENGGVVCWSHHPESEDE